MFASSHHILSSQKRHTPKKSSQISFKKLTHGLQNYKQIKQAHLKNRGCDDTKQYKQNRECTFQPQLISSTKNVQKSQRRSLKKFLQDQQRFTTDKKTKIQQLRQQIAKTEQDQYRPKPSIDSQSQRISAHMGSEQVFQRLSKQKKIIHNVEVEEMFSPKICSKSKDLKRDHDVSSLLYKDAIRRRQKQELNFAELLKKQFIPSINSNTNDLVIKKFYSEFTQIVLQEFISPLLAITVLSQLFNVDLNPNKCKQQEDLCEKVLFFIADTKTEMVNAEVLWNFIQTIVNGHLMNSNFNQQQEDKILQLFGHFYGKRLTKPKKCLTPQKCTFKPQTLRNSQKLAQKHRQRTLSSVNEYLQSQKVNIEIINQSVRIQDLFIIQHMKKNAQNQRKRIQKQNLQLQKCSFRPDLRLTSNLQQKGKKKINLIIPKSTKTQQLQKRFKIKQNQEQIVNKQNQRLKTMYQQSRVSKKVNLNATLRSKNTQNDKSIQKPDVKNIQKSVMRVQLARKNRELKSSLQQRGYPSNVQNWESFRQSMKKEVEVTNEKILKGYSLEKSTVMKSSSSLMKKQVY